MIIGVIVYFAILIQKSEVLMSNKEIKNIANNYQYEIADEKLKKVSNDLLGNGTVIVSKESASSKERAQELSREYKNNINEGLSNELNNSSYQSYTNFEYVDSLETACYYKYIGEYSYEYKRTSTLIEEHSSKYIFLIFKSDYFDYPYLKNYYDVSSIKEFGDILAILNFGKNKIIKSVIGENEEEFTYNLYYISKSYSGPQPDSSGLVADVITATHYALNKATFIVNKSTGATNLNINQSSYLGDMEYKNSYYPRMNTETIKYFSE